MATRRGNFNLLYSLDNGQHWQTLVKVPVDGFHNSAEVAIVPKEDVAQPLRFLLGTGAESSSGQLFRSGDFGEVWAESSLGFNLECDSSNGLYTLVTSPADPQRGYALVACYKYVNAHEGTYKEYLWDLRTTADGGVTWEDRMLPLGFYDSEESSINKQYMLASPVEPTRLYLNEYPQLGVMGNWQRSDNAGESWVTEPFSLSVLAPDWTNASKLYGVQEGDEESVYYYTGKRSINAGQSREDWPQQPCRTTFVQLVSLPAADTLLMLCNQGLYRTTNAGDSWELLTSISNGTLSVHTGDRGVVLWVRGMEIFASRDQGATWSPLASGWQQMSLPIIYRR